MLRTLFLLGAPVFFSFGLWNVLLLPMAIKELGATEFEYGLQEGLTSVGFVVGALFMARYSDRLPIGLWLLVGYLGMGIGGVLYGLSPTIGIAIIWVIALGLLQLARRRSRRQTLLQRNTPRELRGRVFSAMFVMRDVIFLAGMAGAGLADVIDVRVLIIFSSLILVVVGVRRAVRPGHRRARRPNGGVASSALRAKPAATPATARARATVATSTGSSAASATFSAAQRHAARRVPQRRDRSATCPRASGSSARATTATCAYFILDGEAAAGIPEAEGGYRGLSTMGAGDFFGEIAALTGSARTADVVVTRPTTLMEVPAETLRAVMAVPEVDSLVTLDAHRAPASG